MFVGQLQLDKNERLQLAERDISCGDVLEVLIADERDSSPRWIETRVEHNGESYYLTGLQSYNPVGLFARMK